MKVLFISFENKNLEKKIKRIFLSSRAKQRRVQDFPQNYFYQGHNRQEGRGTEYLIITKERLKCWRLPTMPLMRDFFIRSRNILFWISSGAYAPYAPLLDTPLSRRQLEGHKFKQLCQIKLLQIRMFSFYINYNFYKIKLKWVKM